MYHQIISLVLMMILNLDQCYKMKTVTIENLSESSAQEVFDYIANHLLKQAKVSVYGGLCRYVGKEGLRCAAGCLFTEEQYRYSCINYPDGVEGRSWYKLVEDRVVPGTHCDLITSLQTIHDSYQPRWWKQNLSHLAKANGLSWNFQSTES